MGSSLNQIQIPIGVKGFLISVDAFKGDMVFDENGEWDGEVIETPGSRHRIGYETPNQILDAGRNIMATSSGWAGAGSKNQVGTGSTEPIPADTQLEGYVTGTSTIYAFSFGAQASEPYFTWYRITYRHSAGAAQGNISEGGVGWSTADGPFLTSRALLVDEFGDQKTSTVLSDELLDVTYEFRYYPPIADTFGTVTLNGVVYDTILRASNVTSGGSNIGKALGVWTGSVVNWSAYDGDIGTIVQGPSGIKDDNDNTSQFNLSYQNNSYEIDMQCDCGVSGWNLDLGIRSINIITNAGQFQIQFNAQSDGSRIPKTFAPDPDFTMSFVWRLGWTVKDDIP